MTDAIAHEEPKPAFNAALVGVIAGLLISLALFVGMETVLPSQADVDEDTNYGYAYSGARSASVDFSTAFADENTMLLFGSSELSTSAELVPQVPSNFFGANSYGVDLVCVGEAYDQSLWQAIAAGAYAPHVSNKKAVILVSPAWFEDAGIDDETFKLKFSYNLYRLFCDNDSISPELKKEIAQRLAEHGIDEMTIAAAQKANPIDTINDAVLGMFDDLRLRRDLMDVREAGVQRVNTKAGEQETPDFDALEVQAYLDAIEACTNNDWGMDDAFYSDAIEGRLQQLAGTQTGETFSNEEEFEDFSLLLDVCEQVGLEPLVVISPVHGPLYDLLGTKVQDREACYTRIAGICAAHQVDYIDFSDREYEEYFLHDIVHFGWVGWAETDEAIYEFAMGR